MKGEWKFFSYLGLLLHLATTSQLEISANHMKGTANISHSIKKPDFALSLSHNIFLGHQVKHRRIT